MPAFNISQTINLTTGGGTFPIDPTLEYGVYSATGSGALTGSWTIEIDPSKLDSIVAGSVFTVYYNASLTLSGNGLTIFGVPFDTSMALQTWKIDLVYYLDASNNLQSQVYVSQGITSDNGVILYRIQSNVSDRAAIEQLNTSPALMIPQAGANDIIKVVDALATIKLITPYTLGADLQLVAEFGLQPQMQIRQALVGTGVTRINGFVQVEATTTGGSQCVQGQGIYLATPGYNPTGGNASSIFVDIIYRIVPFLQL